MPSESKLISEIEGKVGRYLYPDWTIGITDDPDRSRREHDNPINWGHWFAFSETSAMRLQQHFVDKGMRKAPDSDKILKNYIYIYR